MKTPIVDFAKEYKSKNALRLHMPGHKGLCNNFAEPFDITEIDGADSLYHADGIISESEKIAGEIFGREMSAKELFDLYHQGDETAVQLIERTADIAAKGIANVGCVIDPDIYVVGGSIANYNPDFVEMIFEKAKTYYIKPEYLCYKHAHFSDDAGLIGAALL